MTADPIRQAFKAYWCDHSPADHGEKTAARADFVAGAKWAAMEAAKLCNDRAYERRDVANEEAVRCAIEIRNLIRKHFGDETSI